MNDDDATSYSSDSDYNDNDTDSEISIGSLIDRNNSIEEEIEINKKKNEALFDNTHLNYNKIDIRQTFSISHVKQLVEKSKTRPYAKEMGEIEEILKVHESILNGQDDCFKDKDKGLVCFQKLYIC